MTHSAQHGSVLGVALRLRHDGVVATGGPVMDEVSVLGHTVLIAVVDSLLLMSRHPQLTEGLSGLKGNLVHTLRWCLFLLQYLLEFDTVLAVNGVELASRQFLPRVGIDK